MRPFLELLGDRMSLADLARLAPALAAGELEALRAEGFLQPTGSAGFEEISVADVCRAVRALWGAGSGGMRTPATVSHAPMHLGFFEIDDEPCELVLVGDDAHAIARAARRRERALVLVPTDRAMTPELRRRHDSRARVRFVVLSECLGVHRGRICRIDLPVPMASPLAPRARAGAEHHAPPSSGRGRRLAAPVFDGLTAWEQLGLEKLDNRTLLARFERRSKRLTARDLGLFDTRASKPYVAFEVLMAFLENDGCLKTRRFGGPRATKTTLSRLRSALKSSFGIDANPFEFKRGMGWFTRFRVGDAGEERERALSPGARAILERAGKLTRR